MKHTFYTLTLCCIHFVLATVGYVPLYVSVPVGVLLALIVSKRWLVTPDWSIVIHIWIFSVYLLNGMSIHNLWLLLGALLLLLYNTQKQQAFKNIQTVQLEVNDKLEAFNETFQQVRQERHDYLKHVSAIAYLLEKDEIDEAKAYMQPLVKRYEQTNLSIKGEHGAMAAVLYTNYERARSENIAINYLLESPISNLPMQSDAIVQLIGNILENAIDACIDWQHTHSEQAFIELSVRKKSGLYIVTCVNTTVPLPTYIADQLFTKAGVTTKPEHSGLGTSIIQQIVDEHNGFLDFIAEKQTFTLTCKIPDVVQ